MSWTEWAEGKNAKARARGRWRELRNFDALGLRGTMSDGRRVVSFAANDYLGLSCHPQVMAAAHEAIDRWGTGAGAARLISGSRPVHAELETQLAEWKGTESALVFPSGFSANVGVLSALAGPGTVIFSDELNHASIIDGCRLARASGATNVVYPHGAASAVAELLAQTERGQRAVVVTDSVFSMDGDAAPVAALAEIGRQHGALLVLDEAHAVLGPHPGDLGCELLRVGTLSKTLGSQGGFVAGPRVIIEMLVNRCRPFIFTTALAPASAAAALAALRVLRSGEGDGLLARLAGHVARVAPGRTVPSPIVPFVVGGEEAALRLSTSLLDIGLLVPAVRPPTVPPGTSRLRVALSAAHTDEEVGMLLGALERLEPSGPAGYRRRPDVDDRLARPPGAVHALNDSDDLVAE
jgi:8-amino-7-oxononanoate synthase